MINSNWELLQGKSMLNFFRKSSKTWVSRVFFAVFAAAMLIIWGVGDGIRFGSSGNDQVLIKVGSEKITAYRFMRDLDLESRHVKASTGKNPNIKALKEKLKARMIQFALLDLEAQRLGITTSDEEVKFLIVNGQEFKDKRGQFSKAIFEGYLNMMHLTEAEFMQNLKRDLTRNKLSETIVLTSYAPDTIAKPMFNWQYEKRAVDVIHINYQSFNVAGDVTAKDLEEHYDKNPKTYTTPERRDVSLIVLSQDNLERQITLTPEEKAAGFAERTDQVAGVAPTEEEAKNILDSIKSDKAAALFNKTIQQLEDDLAGGATPEGAANDHKLSIVQIIGLTKDGGYEKADPTVVNFIPKIAQESFALQLADEVPLKEMDGKTYVAIKVNRINAKNLRPLAEVQEEVRKAVTIEKQITKAKELAEQIKAKINSGAAVAEAIKGSSANKGKSLIINKIDKKEGDNPYIMLAGFTAAKGKSEIAPTEQGFAIVVASKIIPVDEKTRNENYSNFKKIVHENIANDLIVQYLVALEKKYTVDVNQGLLEKISGRE